ncbi:VgrG-related protein [Nakamurella lactea]|uniref:VgrG-related protein n=1 Tax=Nakamurella lactea TaxID=459515 RepID=UPI000408AA39|nr:hypothetical protein [Nakamurella lactea]
MTGSRSAEFLGANPDQLRALGRQITQGAQTLGEIGRRTTAQLTATAWYGPDRDRFAGQWDASCEPALTRVSAAMLLAAKDLVAQAAEQDAASGAAGSAPAAPVASSGAGPAPSAPTESSESSAPSAQPAPPAPPAPPESSAQPAPMSAAVEDRYGHPSGALSAAEESNGRLDTVSTGIDDPGGVSYGTFQISTPTMPEYVKWAAAHDPAIAAELKGLTPGSAAFKTEWQALAQADPEGFGKSQYDFIAQTHYQPVVRSVEAAVPGFSLQGRSPVVAEAMWSMAVQHRGFSVGVMTHALAGKDVAAMSDADLVTAMYDERGRDDGRAHFPSSPPNIQHNVVARFEREKQAALDLLAGGH